MRRWEIAYADIIADVLMTGDVRATRNATTKAKFGYMLKVPVGLHTFPLLQGRKMFPKGVFGEFAAMLRRPTNARDFADWGCPYWDLFGDAATGDLRLDYGNKWFDFNGVNQIEQLKHKLANDPNDRAMLVTGWDPGNLANLSLRCCHHTYQFFVAEGRLHMSWSQRSVDLMVGLPSDIAFAAAWLISLAREFHLKTGDMTLFLGDCHIYESHFEGAKEYLHNVQTAESIPPVLYEYTAPEGFDFCKFEPSMLKLEVPNTFPKIPLELIA